MNKEGGIETLLGEELIQDQALLILSGGIRDERVQVPSHAIR